MIEIKAFGSSSAGNSYLLQDGDRALLLEAGIRPKKMSINWSKVDALLITHEHLDHSRYAKDYLKRGAFSIYCTKGTAKNLQGVADHRVMGCDYLKQFTVKGWHIMAFKVEHDTAEPSGFLIQTPSGKKVLFATDTYYIRYKFNDITHMMVECNYSMDIINQNLQEGRIHKSLRNRVIKSHFELDNVINFLESNDLSQLEEVHLLHLSDTNSNAAEFKQKIQAATGVPVYVAEGV
jgi:phosphoribosyl 1,2-cyclic phosphodiesterase